MSTQVILLLAIKSCSFSTRCTLAYKFIFNDKYKDSSLFLISSGMRRLNMFLAYEREATTNHALFIYLQGQPSSQLSKT